MSYGKSPCLMGKLTKIQILWPCSTATFNYRRVLFKVIADWGIIHDTRASRVRLQPGQTCPSGQLASNSVHLQGIRASFRFERGLGSD